MAGLSPEVVAEGTILDGRPAHQLALRSKRLDILVVGSRGYGVLRAALAGGVSGRVLRDAHCPVIAVPPGAEASVGELFGAASRALARGAASHLPSAVVEQPDDHGQDGLR